MGINGLSFFHVFSLIGLIYNWYISATTVFVDPGSAPHGGFEDMARGSSLLIGILCELERSELK